MMFAAFDSPPETRTVGQYPTSTEETLFWRSGEMKLGPKLGPLKPRLDQNRSRARRRHRRLHRRSPHVPQTRV